jgi:hypothetical protein
MAEQIRRRLACQDEQSHQSLCVYVANLLSCQRAVDAGWHRIDKARRRGWHAAADQARDELFRLVHQLNAAATVLVSSQPSLVHPPSIPPTLRALHEELQQLYDEFENVALDVKGGRVIAHTPPLVLDELELGPFAIELHVHSLDRSRADSGCFEIVALQANPAASNADVTHPHVSGKSLCAGDAAVPIAQSLRQGRIADAFCLVRSVLNNYNPHSPYVSIEDWSGVQCKDCGDSVHDDDLYTCPVCNGRYCGHCTGCCEQCDQSACHGCLERDPVSRRDCCPACRSNCSECGRVVDGECFNQQSERCPECDQKQSNDPDSPDPEENSYEREADGPTASLDPGPRSIPHSDLRSDEQTFTGSVPTPNPELSRQPARYE